MPEPALPSRGRRAPKADQEGLLGTVALSQAVTLILIAAAASGLSKHLKSQNTALEPGTMSV